MDRMAHDCHYHYIPHSSFIFKLMSLNTLRQDGLLEFDVADQMRADIHLRATQALANSEKEKANLVDVSAFELRREQVRQKFLDAIGGLPQQKTPLNVRVTGVIESSSYNIEKTLFESLPGYVVSASCYVPHNLKQSAPAVLLVCGHDELGKAGPTYQAVCHDLAVNGFIVLAIDPIGQGERDQYFEGDTVLYPSCIEQHTHAGFPFYLMGASVTRYFIWDAIRAVDYLVSRPDVDENRIGLTGNSGGGTQSCFLMMCEPRLAAAVPCTFVTTLESILRSGAPQDAEQIVHGCMDGGPDHDDFLVAMAPKPVLVGAVGYDFFPIEGTYEAVSRAKRIYDLYDRSQNIELAVDPKESHSYSEGLRHACVKWFKRHLQSEPSDLVIEPFEARAAQELYASPMGQVVRDTENCRTIADLTKDYLNEISDGQQNQASDELRSRLENILGVALAGSRDERIFPRIVQAEIMGWQCEKIWFFSAPNVSVSGLLFHPQTLSSDKPVTVLYVKPEGTDAIEEDQVLPRLLKEGKRVFVLDVRGVGSVRTRSVSIMDGSEFEPLFNTEHRLACDVDMVGISTLGLRVFDILRAYDYLKGRDDTSNIGIYGVGNAGNWAFFAAVLANDFCEITCQDTLTSYRELCLSPKYDHLKYGMNIMAYGLLRCGDISDLIPCITSAPVRFINL
jgi:cephalosporin-C deacetylase-like acetyl esterase